MTTSGRCGTSRSPSGGARASASSASTARGRAPSSRSSPALYPTEGTFEIRGRVLSLLELGTGLNPELTGRQNVINSSRLLAFPPGYATERMPQIEAFAELPDGFFDRPVKLYSSGMLVRLVFSMFACFDPDVFVIDEALSVGDVFFQQKCARRLAEMKAAGVTMLFVSHDLAAVEALCDRVLVLHHGRVEHDGDKKTGIRVYYACGGQGLRREAGPAAARPRPAGNRASRAPAGASRNPTAAPNPPRTFRRSRSTTSTWQAPDARDALGDGRVEITGVAFRQVDAGGLTRADPVVSQGGWLEVLMRAEVRSDAPAVNLGIGLYDRLNRLLFGGRLGQRRAARDRPAGRRRGRGAVRGKARPRAGRVHPLPRRRPGPPRPRQPRRLGPEPRRRPLPRAPPRRGRRGAPRRAAADGPASARPTSEATWMASSSRAPRRP